VASPRAARLRELEAAPPEWLVEAVGRPPTSGKNASAQALHAGLQEALAAHLVGPDHAAAARDVLARLAGNVRSWLDRAPVAGEAGFLIARGGCAARTRRRRGAGNRRVVRRPVEPCVGSRKARARRSGTQARHVLGAEPWLSELGCSESLSI
jgi:hypothetical protein